MGIKEAAAGIAFGKALSDAAYGQDVDVSNILLAGILLKESGCAVPNNVSNEDHHGFIISVVEKTGERFASIINLFKEQGLSNLDKVPSGDGRFNIETKSKQIILKNVSEELIDMLIMVHNGDQMTLDMVLEWNKHHPV